MTLAKVVDKNTVDINNATVYFTHTIIRFHEGEVEGFFACDQGQAFFHSIP